MILNDSHWLDARSAVASAGKAAWPVTDFPKFDYSNKQVVRAGEALKGDLMWSDERADEIREIFRIANNWRDSHTLPMNRIRHELLGKMRAAGVRGLTAARLKRMSSIRKKLQRIPAKLNQLQDLAGVRAIVPAIADVRTLVDFYKRTSHHDIYDEDNYINKPKADGYRSYHLMFRFKGAGEYEAFDRRRVELQVRTRLQHSWATAVEAVGLFRNEDMKGGFGNAEWLRLFQLMSIEFSIAEKCDVAIDPGQSRKLRLKEIQELERELDAVSTLESLRAAVRYTDTYLQDPNSRDQYFLIQYDIRNSTVTVNGYSKPTSGTMSYDAAESASREVSGDIKTVLVEADKVEILKEAYPNYFGDVALFRKQLQSLSLGKDAKEYTLPPQKVAPPPPREATDTSWFRRHKKWS